MEPKLYMNIVSVIDKYRTWIKVANINGWNYKYIVLNGKLVQCSCRVLTLKSFGARWGIVQPRIWHITWGELAVGINKLCSKDRYAKDRVQKCELTINDVEYIIKVASNGILKLGLGRYGFG